MKKGLIILLSVLPYAVACGEYDIPGRPGVEAPPVSFSKKEIAGILSQLPMGEEQLSEVYNAVNSSSQNGYDEEYTLEDLFLSPGAGVGDRKRGTRASITGTPLRSLFEDYFSERAVTRSGEVNIRACLDALASSGMQIYVPYSEDWDGETYPIITFDPGYGAESNYGYEVRFGEDGVRVIDTVYVDEAVASSRPVWVINNNVDSGFTPFEMFLTKSRSSDGQGEKRLMLKTFRMLRNYDTWFAGGSEFHIQMGSVDGFSASTEAELKLYSPSISEFTVVVKRKQLGQNIQLNSIILTDFTEQLEKLAFLVTEDDGGTRTGWKCSATVKVQSRSYGFDLDLPYNDKDDIVWRGQLAASYFRGHSFVTGRFGDVEITFGLE